MKLSIVIPCYNEGKNIPLILEKFSEVLVGQNGIEIIFVNNNSTDNSAEVLANLVPLYSFAKTIFEPMPGYGAAIIAGLRSASGEFIGWTHGDMQASPVDIISALEIIEKHEYSQNVYLKGKRLGRSLVDNFFTIGMGIFESLYLKTWLFDINAQPNIFHRSFFKKWKNPPIDFSLDLYSLYLAKKFGLKIIRYPVQFLPRLHGKSSWNRGWGSRFKFIKRTLVFSFKLKGFLVK